MLLERVLLPVAREVLVYRLVGHDEYGQPQYAPISDATRRGLVRRTTRVEQHGERAVAVASTELVLLGADQSPQALVGAKVVVGGDSQEYVVRVVRRDGEPFAPVFVCELEGISR